MPITQSVQNAFTKGLLTEFSGLNFPEEAATDADNTLFSITGSVLRRQGFDYEANYTLNTIPRTNLAINTYKWNNAGGDGNTQVVVQQTGSIIYFYKSSAATVVAPLSSQILASTVDMSTFVASGGTFDATVECQFSDGNGYLFVYHPSCDTVYCTFNAGTITGNAIIVQTRDFAGIPEIGVADGYRPLTLSNEHKYNLLNQGWLSGNPWSATSSSSVVVGTGAKTFTVATGISGVSAGQAVSVVSTAAFGGGAPQAILTGTVTSYNSGTGSLVLSITSVIGTGTFASWIINPTILGFVNTWFAAIGHYPSNSDVWWNFKNTLNVFDPANTQANTSAGAGPAPKGHNVLNTFQQLRASVSAVSSLTDITTTVRPRTGTWFQGRVWYTGVDAQQAATGDAPYVTWTESIYFSKIVQTTTDFGQCYQQNDPTSQDLFDLLPTDGGVMVIQGCGPVYKLFPIQNGMLVFAANGVWFITGSTGIGFAANDYTITKISAVQSISSTSFVDVNGLPYFWNEEGIYSVSPAKQGGLQVEPLTVGTILTLYNSIPRSAKSYVRGVYHPIDYTIQWIYKSSDYTSVTNRYDFDRILNFNTFSRAFFPYSLQSVTGKPHVHGINYVAGPGGSTSPDPVFKYLTAASNGAGSYNFTFSEERDGNYVDFVSFDSVGVNYVSSFTTGYRLAGKALLKFQPVYVYVYSDSTEPTSYKIQGIWDYASTGDSGRWSTAQLTNNWAPNYTYLMRKHKIRGHGLALQFKITSSDGQPFNIIGWASWEMMNAGI